MNPMQNSHEELKEMFRQNTISSINVTQYVMNRIIAKREKRRSSIWMKTSLIMTLLLILVIPSGFALFDHGIWNLFNHRGELTMQLKTVQPDEVYWDMDRSVSDEVIAKLLPGEAAIIYKEGIVGLTEVSNPLKYTSLYELKSKVTQNIRYPAVIPQGFTFVSGEIIYFLERYDFQNVLAALKREVSASGKHYAYMKYKLSSQAYAVSLTYQNEQQQTIFVNINFSENNKRDNWITAYTVDDGSDIGISEKIHVGSTEGIYFKGAEYQVIRFADIDLSIPTAYMITSPTNDGVSKQDLILLAENIK